MTCHVRGRTGAWAPGDWRSACAPLTRRAKAQELIERLVAEGRVRFADPDDDEVAERRRVVNYAKRHGLEPEGKRIEKVRYGGPGLELFLAEGPHRNVRSQRSKAGGAVVPVPSRLAHLHPAGDAALLQGLAAEAVRRGHEVRDIRGGDAGAAGTTVLNAVTYADHPGPDCGQDRSRHRASGPRCR